jgi:endonuclease/exonuclease/phosphatase (EEP) superfamily protein YafD
MFFAKILLLLDQLRLPILAGISGMGVLLLIFRARIRYYSFLALVSFPLCYPIVLQCYQIEKAASLSLPLKILHQNCCGNNPNTDAIFDHIKASRPDVVLLQECNPALYWRLRKELTPLGYALSSDFENYDPRHHHRYNRLIILTKGFKISKRYKLKDHPVLVVHARSFKTGDRYRFVSVHLKRCYTVTQSYYQTVADQLGPFEGKTILSGDFNLVPWSSCYHDFCEMMGLKDGLKGHGLMASFPAPQNTEAIYKAPAFLPIDRLLLSPDVHTDRVERLPSLGSDHYGFMAYLT